MKLLTYEEATAAFSCDFNTGKLYWKASVSRKIQPGSLAGTVNSQGYLQIQYKGHIYRAHHIVFLLYYKRWPQARTDHKDGNRQNNRPDNLTDAPGNHKNVAIQARNKTGVIGVWFHAPSQRYHAAIRVSGKKKHLGSFLSLEDARQARAIAEQKYGFSDNHGKRLSDKHIAFKTKLYRSPK